MLAIGEMHQPMSRHNFFSTQTPKKFILISVSRMTSLMNIPRNRSFRAKPNSAKIDSITLCIQGTFPECNNIFYLSLMYFFFFCCSINWPLRLRANNNVPMFLFIWWMFFSNNKPLSHIPYRWPPCPSFMTGTPPIRLV